MLVVALKNTSKRDCTKIFLALLHWVRLEDASFHGRAGGHIEPERHCERLLLTPFLRLHSTL